MPFAFGEAIDGLVAWALDEWWVYQIAISAPLFGMLVLYFIVPESPRWLIAKGRYKEAKNVIERAAKINKVSLWFINWPLDGLFNNFVDKVYNRAFE